MANVRLALVLAGWFMVLSHPDLASARPQFGGNFGPVSVGMQGGTFPLFGASLGIPSGFPFSFGQSVPQQQVPQQQAPQQQAPQQQYTQQQVPQQQASQQQAPQQQYPQQQVPQQQYPSQQVPQQQVPQQQPTSTKTDSTSESLGSRFGGESEPVEDNPCQNVDASTGSPNETESDVTEQPCLGIGAGNRINPKQAALLSLVG